MKHQPNFNYRIQRKPEILSMTGFSRSTLHARIKDELFVPPISLGERAVGWVSHETEAIVSAMVAGKNKDQLKALVSSLVAQRKNAGVAQ